MSKGEKMLEYEDDIESFEAQETIDLFNEIPDAPENDESEVHDFDSFLKQISSSLQHTKNKKIHNYTSELELKTLIIRLNNKHKYSTEYNAKINKYVKLFEKLDTIKYKKQEQTTKKSKLRKKIKARAIALAEKTSIDRRSYELFGKIIILMINRILTRQQFYSYTYKDDFYSDSVYKILKYIHNFDHKLISKRTGEAVNSFAYVSQIIHNSIIFIIKKNNKINEDNAKMTRRESLNHEVNVNSQHLFVDNFYYDVVAEPCTRIVFARSQLDIDKYISEIYNYSLTDFWFKPEEKPLYEMNKHLFDLDSEKIKVTFI